MALGAVTADISITSKCFGLFKLESGFALILRTHAKNIKTGKSLGNIKGWVIGYSV